MNNFAVLDIAYSHTPATIIISITTNMPSHLSCFYTDKKPLRHKTSRRERGIDLPWGAYFCFVAWKELEQLEPGDTLSHTFKIPDWLYCQTWWFAFRGTVSETLSPSVSCIFEHHHPGADPPLIEEQTAGTWLVHFAGGVFWDRIGQRLYILDRSVVGLSFYTKKVGSPPGIITFTIRRSSDDTILASKLYGNANDVPAIPGWINVTFDSPIDINERVRILMEWTGPPGDISNYLEFWGTLTDVKPNENVNRWYNLHGYWTTTPSWDAKYRYTYYPDC